MSQLVEFKITPPVTEKTFTINFAHPVAVDGFLVKAIDVRFCDFGEGTPETEERYHATTTAYGSALNSKGEIDKRRRQGNRIFLHNMEDERLVVKFLEGSFSPFHIAAREILRCRIQNYETAKAQELEEMRNYAKSQKSADNA